MTTDDDSYFFCTAYDLQRNPKRKENYTKKKDVKNLQNYTNIFLSFFLLLSTYSPFLFLFTVPQSVCVHACMKIAFELGIKRLDGVFEPVSWFVNQPKKLMAFSHLFHKDMYLSGVLFVSE